MLSLGGYPVDHRIKMIHAPAATKQRKSTKKERRSGMRPKIRDRGRVTYGESGIRSLMDIKRSSMSAVSYKGK